MMFEVRRFHPDDILPLLAEPMNARLAEWQTNGHPRVLAEHSVAFSGFVENQIMVCGGIAPLWEGRGYLWAVLSENIKAHSISVYRGIRRFLEAQPFRRIEMDSPVDFELGHRRAEWLGFKLEVACAKKYLPDGRDASIYAWVRE